MTKKHWPLIIVLSAFATTACSQVDAGHVGIVVMWGEIQPTALPEGLYATMPVKTKVINISTRVMKLEADASASSRDLQVVRTNIALNYRLRAAKMVEVFRNIGNLRTVESTIIQPALQEAVKKATAQYTAEELITKRQLVKEAIAAAITKTLDKSNVNVTELSITDFKFDQKYQAAVEAKQVAEQRALTAKNDLDRIKVEADQANAVAEGQARAIVLKAKAEAESQRLLRETITAEIVYLRAIEKWDGRQPTVVGDGGAILDLGAVSQAKKRAAAKRK